MGRLLVQASQSSLGQEQQRLRQRLRLATDGPRESLHREVRQVSSLQHGLRRAAQQATDRQRRRVRQLGRTVLRRFRQLQQRRREALLRCRYKLEVAAVRATARHALALSAAATRHAALDHASLGQRGYLRADSLHPITPEAPAGTLLLLQLPEGPLPVQVVDLTVTPNPIS
jgi:exodeoxyribonuclease VII large subunit